jgi:hypothetical protein
LLAAESERDETASGITAGMVGNARWSRLDGFTSPLGPRRRRLMSALGRQLAGGC